MFYHFDQNNSGGHFDFDERHGITANVIIEAVNAQQANNRAEDIGIYFDGCSTGRDCHCCGDRWYEADETDANSEPSVHGGPVAEVYEGITWMEEGKETCVHYLDGRKEWF
jgi:hypothetical protein